MTLNELISALETFPGDYVPPMGFESPHSYRGDYEMLAFKPRPDNRIDEMIDCARCAIGETFVGYKGGDFMMTGDTIVNIAEYGYSNSDGGISAHMFIAAMREDYDRSLFKRCLKSMDTHYDSDLIKALKERINE